MTVCYALPLPSRTLTIEFDPDADWPDFWLVAIVRDLPYCERRELRRYATYTEARRALALLRSTHERETG